MHDCNGRADCGTGRDGAEKFEKVIRIDEGQIRSHVDEVVRESVEEILNGLLDAEAEQLCRAKRYERTADRADTRAGHYTRKLQTKAGEVELQVPRLRKLPLETQIIERYRRRESSVEEAMVEMYLAGVSVRRVEDITEALWGSRVSPSAVSELNQKIYDRIDGWRNRPIEGEYVYVYLDGICLKWCFGGEVQKVSVLVAIGVGTDGYREVLGVCEGTKEDSEGWRNFLRHLKSRGLRGVRLIISMLTPPPTTGIVSPLTLDPPTAISTQSVSVETSTCPGGTLHANEERFILHISRAMKPLPYPPLIRGGQCPLWPVSFLQPVKVS